ncbi:MAG: hypothetical protein U9Q22_00025 [Candidatus Altiarchaeota archaeon]|nr:hypothetical protein [Candidatus Altiarchaeota archaeon]
MGERVYQQESMELEWRSIFINVMNLVISDLKDLYTDLPDFILLNPPLGHELIYGMINSLIQILQPFYTLVILVTGIYLIFLSGSPKGRARVRSLFPRLIASMVLVSLSSPILQLIYNSSHDLTQEILKRIPVDPAKIFLDTIDGLMLIFSSGTLVSLEGGHIFLLLAFISVLGIFMVLALRYVILLLFTLIFPASIFLYTFGFTRNMGRTMIEQTLVWTFMQVIVAIVLLTANVGISLMSLEGDLVIIAGFMAFILITTSPLILLSFARRFLP